MTTANFTTKAVNISLYATDISCTGRKQTPYATVLQEDISDNKLIIRDLNFDGCSIGDIYANIYLWRGLKDPLTAEFNNLFVTNYLDYYLGTFGCDPTCLRCNGTSSSDCLLCTDYLNSYLSNGTCL